MSHKILFVDDNIHLLDSFRRSLRKQFHITTATSGHGGLEKIKQAGPFAVIVSDLHMAGMDGFHFLSQVKTISPESVAIMLTGHADLNVSLKAVNEGYIFRFLTKPCKPQVLSKAITAGIELYKRNIRNHAVAENPAETTVVRKKILVVDDDPEELFKLSNALNTCGTLDVFTAENGHIAWKLLNTITPDMVIADNEMPRLNGPDLLARISSRYPDIPLVLTTWCMTRQLESEIHSHNVFRYFEKPLHIDGLRKTVMDEIYAGPIGIIDGISTAAFVQMIENEEKTCTLKIKSAGHMGTMHFLKGSLINAESGKIQGERAAYEIINWNNPSIEIENQCRKRERKINQPLMQLLFEAAKIKDEN